MRITKTFVLAIAVLALSVCFQANAQSEGGSFYQSGYSNGVYDKSFGSTFLDSAYSTYLSSPTQDNWDYYFGYYHAINGIPENYAAVPPISYYSPLEYYDSDESLSLQYENVNRGTNRLATTYRKLTRKLPEVAAAGALNNVSATVDYSYGMVEDDILGGDVLDMSGGVLLNGMIGDDLMLAFGYARSTYRGDEDVVVWDQATDSLDFYFTYQANDVLNVGAFLTFSTTDLEDRTFGLLTLPGFSTDRWGGGLLASTDVALCEWANLGIVGTYATMNKSSIGAFFDDEDSAGILLVDVTTFPSDNLTASLYGSYFGLVDRDFGPDGSYFTFGVEAGWNMCSNASMTIGYEINEADNDREVQRVNIGLVVNF